MTEEKKYVGRGGNRGGGRPKGTTKPTEEKRERFQVSCHPADRETIRTLAKNEGMNQSQLIVEAVRLYDKLYGGEFAKPDLPPVIDRETGEPINRHYVVCITLGDENNDPVDGFVARWSGTNEWDAYFIAMRLNGDYRICLTGSMMALCRHIKMRGPIWELKHPPFSDRLLEKLG